MKRVAAERVNLGGFVVAGVGFLLTRFTVLESLHVEGTVLGFLAGEALFLALGLGLTAFGIALAVSTYASSDVNAVALWSLLGVGGMVLVVGLAHLEAGLGGAEVMAPSNRLTDRILIVGGIGGVLTGLRAASNRRQRRELALQADRATVLNRILRHEVLNKVGVITGYTDLMRERGRDDDRLAVVHESATHIDDAISEVSFLTRAGDSGAAEGGTVDLVDVVRSELEAARETHPEATFVLADAPEEPVVVRATERLSVAFAHLFDNAVRHDDDPDPTVTVSLTCDPGRARVSVDDEGPGLPPAQQRVLENRELPQYDDPGTGFGLSITALVLEQFGASADVTASEGRGTTVTVEFERAVGAGAAVDGGGPYGVTPVQLSKVAVAATVGGVAMGLVQLALTGQMAVIGALYGVPNPIVGWLTHMFHSLVFGVAFSAALVRPRFRRYLRRPLSGAGAGVAYGGFLWLFAAGVVMPVWLRGVGVPAPVPNLSLPGLVGHVVWGVLLGGLYALLVGDGLRSPDQAL